MTENPAGTIRRAAALMRERAEAATPGPWSMTVGTWMDTDFPSVLGADGDPENPATWLMATSHDGAKREANATHAASWHPLSPWPSLTGWIGAAMTRRAPSPRTAPGT